MVQMSQHKLPKRGNEGRDRFLEMLHHLNMLFIIPTYAYIYSITGIVAKYEFLMLSQSYIQRHSFYKIYKTSFTWLAKMIFAASGALKPSYSNLEF